MTTDERRNEILTVLRRADSPVPARELAARFGVSRQVIVQDMAVIRASVSGILSTARGYLLQQDGSGCCCREFKVRHGEEDTEKELTLIVDCGGHVRNISISHRVYGRISADMDVHSRQDVKEFMEALEGSSSSVLSSATSGYHYHLVEAPTPDRLDIIEEKLRESGFLAPRLPWEQEV